MLCGEVADIRRPDQVDVDRLLPGRLPLLESNRIKPVFLVDTGVIDDDVETVQPGHGLVHSLPGSIRDRHIRLDKNMARTLQII